MYHIHIHLHTLCRDLGLTADTTGLHVCSIGYYVQELILSWPAISNDIEDSTKNTFVSICKPWPLAGEGISRYIEFPISRRWWRPLAALRGAPYQANRHCMQLGIFYNYYYHHHYCYHRACQLHENHKVYKAVYRRPCERPSDDDVITSRACLPFNTERMCFSWTSQPLVGSSNNNFGDNGLVVVLSRLL